MASKVDIMNIAILQLGDEIIMSPDEDSKPARTMRTLWDITLREVLEDHTWGFARKRAALALLSTAPAFGFDNAFQLPTDYVRMVYMGEEDDELTWQVEGDQLLTNESEANITYIRLVEDTHKFSGKFCSALSLLLAARAADTLAGMDTAKQAKMLAAYDKVVMDAATVDSQNSTPRIQQPNRWHNARNSGVAY